jgi:hypothetical protein
MWRFANANRPLRYLIQNSTKSLCPPLDSNISDFCSSLILTCSAPILVTV